MKQPNKVSMQPLDAIASCNVDLPNKPIEHESCDKIEELFQMGFTVDLSWDQKAQARQFACCVKREGLDGHLSKAFYGDSFAEVIACANRWSKEPPELPLERAFSGFVNMNSLENGSNTPDFLLGGFLADTLVRLDTLIKARDKWYGVNLEPGVHRCSEYDWEHGERVTINVGAVFKIGKRLWRLKGLPAKEQGEDMWHFESTEPSSEMRGGCPFDRLFTRSEVQWLYSHGSFVGQPVDAEGAVL